MSTIDSQTQPVVFAGSGLLRWGTTLSVNPVQKLRKVTIAEKLTVPEPTDTSDAASKSYVDSVVSSGTVTAGAGLKSTGLSLYVAPHQVFDSVKLTGLLTDDSQAVPKRYVDKLVEPMVTQDYVRDHMANVVKSADLQSALEPVATRSYIESKFAHFATKSDVEKSVENLIDKTVVESAVQNLASIPFVESAVKGFATRDEVQTILDKSVTKSYLDSQVSQYITKDEATVLLQDYVTNTDMDSELTEVYSRIVDDGALSKVVKTYVDAAIEELASKNFVESIVTPLAEEVYVDEAVSGLATKAYVDDKVDEALGVVNLQLQYTKPVSANTVTSNGAATLLLDPETAVDDLEIAFPPNPNNGQVLTILASRDVTNVKFANLTTVGDIAIPHSVTLTPGSSLKFMYSTDGGGWFTF